MLGLSCGMRDLVPRPGIEPGSPTLWPGSSSRWTTGDVPVHHVLLSSWVVWEVLWPQQSGVLPSHMFRCPAAAFFWPHRRDGGGETPASRRWCTCGSCWRLPCESGEWHTLWVQWQWSCREDPGQLFLLVYPVLSGMGKGHSRDSSWGQMLDHGVC